MCPIANVVPPMTLAIVQGIGVTELLIVLAIMLLIFGPKRLPGLGRQLGSGMRDFKDSISRRHAEDDAEPEDDVREGEAVPVRRELPSGDR